MPVVQSRSFIVLLAVLSAPILGSSQTPAPALLPKALNDKPKVAIIQYESGRVLVVQEVNGELLVVEPRLKTAAILARYLGAAKTTSQEQPPSQPDVPSDRDLFEQNTPFFYSPQWYPYATHIDSRLYPGITHHERAIERRKQDAVVLREQVKARRQQQGTTGATNSAGRVYPLTASNRPQAESPGGAYAGADQSAFKMGGPAYDSLYRLGSEFEYYRQQELAARRELALLTYDVLLKEGLDYFHNRRYAQAARSFIAAADKDHGDAGSRLHAAQCLMSSGLYSQALVYVRRAFELAPQLIYRPLNHRDNYSFPLDFDRHLAEMERYVEAHPKDDDAVLLLAYEQFFSVRPSRAAKAMRRVKRLAKSDGFARRLWQAAQPVFGDL
ncbi:MAG: hypothetical protein IIB58_07105 [Planctomycetes bacterium]|nr:hypothetical protein [Planctomycetota bacterium]